MCADLLFKVGVIGIGVVATTMAAMVAFTL